MDARKALQLAALGLLAALTPRGAASQATLYTAGDPAAATTVATGREVCGTSTVNMSAIDTVSYATFNASEFAALVPELRGSVPSPMGNDTSAVTSGRWGVTIVNPTRSPINVTQVQIAEGGVVQIFQGFNAVFPLNGWVSANNTVTWTGSVDVPPLTALSFIVQIRPRGRDIVDTAITLTATTSIGVLSSTGWTTNQRNSNNCPYVSLPFVVGGLDTFSGVTGNGGAIETGRAHTFTVKIAETEVGNNLAIPIGTTLTISVPPDWTITQPSNQTGLNVRPVTQPTRCTPGSIIVDTTTTIINSSRLFQFELTPPARQGGVGLYTLTTRLQNATVTPPIDTRTEFVQEVTTPPFSGVRAGITAAAAYLAVPNPMGSNKFTTWGVAVANPTDNPLTVTSINIVATGGTNNDQLFKAVQGIRPTTGWTHPNGNRQINWAGSVTVGPHEAANFVASIQGNGKNGVDRPVEVRVNGLPVRTTATTQNQGNPPAANLYYSTAGQPAVYTFGVASGSPRTFQVTIKETQNVNINAGAVLRIVVPAGWTNVDAPLNQTDFSNRAVVQPTTTPPADGEIRTTLTRNFKNQSRTFTFTATAPPSLLDSLFVFPTTLTSAQVRSSCEMVALVVDASGGLEVVHQSPPVAPTNINQIDVHAVATAMLDTTFADGIYNFATSSWEPLTSQTLSTTASTYLDPITSNFGDYFDAPLTDPNKHLRVRMRSNAFDNHRLDEDYVAFVVSEYRVVPTTVAPALSFRGQQNVPMLALRFETEAGSVDLNTMKVFAIGSDPAVDVAQVRLYEDLDCDGVVDTGEVELAAPQALDANNAVTFGNPLLTFSSSSPACALLAIDVTPAAGAFDIIHLEIANGFDLTSSVGALFPFPSASGYPIASDDTLIPGGPPSLELAKTVDPTQTSYPVGSVVTYSIAVTNLGESASTNVQVSDPLDPSWAPYTGVITPLDGGSLCLPPTCATPQVVWPPIPSLAGNGSQVVTLRFEATIPMTTPDQTKIDNTAHAVSNEQPGGVDSSAADINACGPVLSLAKTLPPTPLDYAVGEIIQWSIQLQNLGGCEATGVLLEDTIDDTLLDETALTLSPPTGTYDPATNRISWSVASVAANATLNFTLAAPILPAAEGRNLCNLASATFDQGTGPLVSDPPSGTCTSVAVQPPRCQPNLLIDKTLPTAPPDYAEGEPIEWTITIRNNGNCDAANVVLRDTVDTTLLDEATLVFDPPTGTYDPGLDTYTWPPATVAGNGSATLTFKVRGVLRDGTEGLTACNVAIANFNGSDILSNPTTGTCASVPVLPGPRCAAAALPAATALRLAKVAGIDIDATWLGPGSSEHHLNQVTDKRDVPNAKRLPVGVGAPLCSGSVTACTILGAVSAPPNTVFYQAVGACGGTGDLEGAL